jgi:hypothetical protein
MVGLGRAMERLLLVVMGVSLLVIGWVIGVFTPTAHQSTTVTAYRAATTVKAPNDAKPVTVVKIRHQVDTTTVTATEIKTHSATVTGNAQPLVGAGGSCTPGYSPCLTDHGGADYDCAGGSGNGPYYTTPGTTYLVTGSDPYGLDANGDGYGCS